MAIIKSGKIQEKIKKIPIHVWILFFIILLGIFLRTYHFRDWLFFGDDQVNDITAVGNTVVAGKAWPAFGPDMGNSPYRLGPMFYYWQIISAKIFGVRPEVMAYPDLLFSVMTIPLLYYFLKKYFSQNLSLLLAGLWSVSFYAIKYSRFGWNINSIPFFSLLFILSLHKFMIEREKTSWFWTVLLGITLGVGVQLHAMLLFLFPAVAFFVFLFIMKKNWKNKVIWTRWVAVLLIMLVLNLGQIIGDAKNNWANYNYFMLSFSDKSGTGQKKMIKNLEMNADCQIQANGHIISSLGDKDNCQFSFYKLGAGIKSKKLWNQLTAPWNLVGLFSGLVFLAVGYILLFWRFKKEENVSRKYLLGLIILYDVLFFLIVNSAIDQAPLRYFIAIAFFPFVLLGLMFDLLIKRFPKYSLALIAPVVIFLVLANVVSIKEVEGELASGARSSYKYVILGEIEPMVNYMERNVSGKQAYLLGDKVYLPNFYKSLAYIAKNKGFALMRASDPSEASPGESVFYIRGNNNKKSSTLIMGRKVVGAQKFGQVVIYQLEN